MAGPSVSIVIPNYNYGRFVGESVRSALAQDGAGEVVVVDDGSTDESREVLHEYRGDIRLIEQSNQGQLAALNAGIHASSGDVVYVLDADDVLLPGAVTAFREPFQQDPSIAKVHWPVRLMDEAGRSKDRCRPDAPLGSGDLLHAIVDRGPDGYPTPPTSGNAWNRVFLDSVLPFPHRPGRASADGYLSMIAPLYGPIAAITQPLSQYREHPRNVKVSLSFDELLDRNLELWEWRAGILAEHCARQGIPVDVAQWRGNAWLHWLADARRNLTATIPAGEPFLLIDDARWGMVGDDAWPALPFVEGDGVWMGPPADDEQAKAELDRRIGDGIQWLVLAWPAHWYLTQYASLADAIDGMMPAFVDDRIGIYRMAAQ